MAGENAAERSRLLDARRRSLLLELPPFACWWEGGVLVLREDPPTILAPAKADRAESWALLAERLVAILARASPTVRPSRLDPGSIRLPK